MRSGRDWVSLEGLGEKEREGGEDIGDGRENVTALLVRLLGEPFDFRISGNWENGDSKGSVGGDEEACGWAEYAVSLPNHCEVSREDGAGARRGAEALRKASAGCWYGELVCYGDGSAREECAERVQGEREEVGRISKDAHGAKLVCRGALVGIC